MFDASPQINQQNSPSSSPKVDVGISGLMGRTEAEGIEQLQEDFSKVVQWLDNLSNDDSVDNKAVSQELKKLGLSSATCLTDSDGLIRGINQAAQTWLAIDESSIGGRCTLSAWHRGNRLEDLSDQMLTMGARQLQYIHETQSPQGQWWRWATIKSYVPAAFGGGEDSVVMTRPVAEAELPRDVRAILLAEQLTRFYELDETDRAICHGIAIGDSTSEIAKSVGLTRRSVEVRRTKILEHFGFARKVQVIRLMVRLEENQLLNA